MKIFCVTLKDSEYRIEMAKKEFERHNLSYEFFYGVNGNNTNLKVINDNEWEHTQMNSGRIGCFLSHFILWNHILYSGYDEVLIVEDDFYINSSFDTILKYKEELPIDWDLFFVGYCCESKMTMVSKNIMTGDGVCTHGYFISKRGINKILSTILPVDLPIDVKMRSFYNKLNVYFSRE